MKRLIVALIFIFLFASLSFAQGTPNQTTQPDGQIESSQAILASNDLEQKATSKTLIKETTLEKSGCCSWHGGVCGCENGRAKCCDGTLSPSCGCD